MYEIHKFSEYDTKRFSVASVIFSLHVHSNICKSSLLRNHINSHVNKTEDHLNTSRLNSLAFGFTIVSVTLNDIALFSEMEFSLFCRLCVLFLGNKIVPFVSPQNSGLLYHIFLQILNNKSL